MIHLLFQEKNQENNTFLIGEDFGLRESGFLDKEKTIPETQIIVFNQGVNSLLQSINSRHSL